MQLRREGDVVRGLDLGSRNGTWVSGQRISRRGRADRRRAAPDRSTREQLLSAGALSAVEATKEQSPIVTASMAPSVREARCGE